MPSKTRPNWRQCGLNSIHPGSSQYFDIWDVVVPLDHRDTSQAPLLCPHPFQYMFPVQVRSLYRVRQCSQVNRIVELTLGCQSYTPSVPKPFPEISVGGSSVLYSAVNVFVGSAFGWEGASDVFEAAHYFLGLSVYRVAGINGWRISEKRLIHYLCFAHISLEVKFSSSFGKYIHLFLDVCMMMYKQSCVIREQKVLISLFLSLFWLLIVRIWRAFEWFLLVYILSLGYHDAGM